MGTSQLLVRAEFDLQLLGKLRLMIKQTRATTVQEMHQHVIGLCSEHEIACSWCRRPSQACAAREFEQICIPPIKSPISYATALHEIGHILGRYQQSSDTMVRERWAWKWATANALIWTPAMDRYAGRSLGFAADAARMSRSRISKRLKETAYHEAGHAVLGRVLTLDSGGATVKPDHDSEGHGITNDPWACIYAWEKRGKVRLPDAVWHARIITFMAGAEAVAELLGLVPRGDGDDRYQIAMMAEELENYEEWDRIEPRLRAMARMLVRRHRALIERVANALIGRTTLSRGELDKLVGRSVDDVTVNAPFLLEMARSRHGSTQSDLA